MDFISIKHRSRAGQMLDNHTSSLGVQSDTLAVTGVIPHDTDIEPASPDDARRLISWLEGWIIDNQT